MASFPVLTLLLSLLALQIWRTRAQMASCGSGWEWTNNTVGQDPCQIVASLDGYCLGAQLVIPALSNGTLYAPPSDGNSQTAICDCNSPIYSLYSACAACQGAGWFKWSEWSKVCFIAHVGVLPDGYFVTTPIPHWAFVNVTVDDSFVPATAMLVGDLPELPMDGPKTVSLPTVSSTLMRVPTSTLSASSDLFSTPPSDLPSVTQTISPKSKNPVGAIAGGTVAGIVVLSLIGFALVLFCKRRGFRIPKIRKASGPMSLFGSEERRSHPRVEEGFALQRPLLYDPTNPATFSQVNAELEKPLQHGSGNPGSSHDLNHLLQPQPLVQ